MYYKRKRGRKKASFQYKVRDVGPIVFIICPNLQILTYQVKFYQKNIIIQAYLRSSGV